MKRGLVLSLVVWLVGVMGFVIHPGLSVGAGESNNVDLLSPLFRASLENSLSDLSSQEINLNSDIFDPQVGNSEVTGNNADSERVIKLAQGWVPPFPTASVTCANSGGATCRGTSTCQGSQTCFGRLTCAETCSNSGGATCRGTATCDDLTCRMPFCEEVSPSH